jgi:tRNA A-37 threonylcarbamoyl transferase component Bud32
MGFLLSNIDEPKFLTKLLKQSVPAEKRKQWSEKSGMYIKLLHDNNIIWGDAKAETSSLTKTKS